jgi:hypothetical protein
MLYRGTLATETKCSICGERRYMDDITRPRSTYVCLNSYLHFMRLKPTFDMNRQTLEMCTQGCMVYADHHMSGQVCTLFHCIAWYIMQLYNISYINAAQRTDTYTICQPLILRARICFTSTPEEPTVGIAIARRPRKLITTSA